MPAIASRCLSAIATALAGLVVAVAPARAQAGIEDTYIFMVTMAERGLACELLANWEAATILAETERMLIRFPETDRDTLAAAAATEAELTACSDPAVNEWIAAARPGIEREWLPPYLALYRSLAIMETPPDLFLQIIGETDLDIALAAIDVQIAALEAAGVLAEGREEWTDYLAIVDEATIDIVFAAAGGEGGPFAEDEATGFIIDAALIVTLWLADHE